MEAYAGASSRLHSALTLELPNGVRRTPGSIPTKSTTSHPLVGERSRQRVCRSLERPKLGLTRRCGVGSVLQDSIDAVTIPWLNMAGSTRDEVRELRLRGKGQTHFDPYVGRGRYSPVPSPPPVRLTAAQRAERANMKFRLPVSERDVEEIYGKGFVERRKEMGVIPAQAWVGCAAHMLKHGKQIPMGKHCQPDKKRCASERRVLYAVAVTGSALVVSHSVCVCVCVVRQISNRRSFPRATGSPSNDKGLGG